MKRWAESIAGNYLNGGTALVLMGVLWLYLWIFPWYESFRFNPDWGHNYTEAAAFLAVGLAYYGRRLISSLLAFIATLLIIPASLELIPHWITAITAGALLVLIVLDIIVERKRERDLAMPANRQLGNWLKKHIPRFSYIILAHLAFIYFLVRLPRGTYETDLVTKVFDGMAIILVIFLLLEDMTGIFNSGRAKLLGFFWGMLTMLVSLGLLADQSATWPTLAITVIVTVTGIAALIVRPRPEETS